MSASLQDVVPWSLIYGELARLQEKTLEDLGYTVVLDYIIDRLNRGWKESDPSQFYSKTLKLCIDRRIVTDADIIRVKIHCIARGMDADYYLDFLSKALRKS